MACASMQQIRVIFVLVIVACTFGLSLGQCNFLPCNEELAKYRSPDPVKNYNASSLTDYCTAVGNFKDCTSSFLDTCYESIRIQIEDTINSDEYLCGDGFSLMVRNQKCLKKPITETITRNCSEYFTKAYDDYYEDWCQYVKLGLQCALNGITSTCGQEAGVFFHRLQLTAFENAAQSKNCTLIELTPAPEALMTTTPPENSSPTNNAFDSCILGLIFAAYQVFFGRF